MSIAVRVSRVAGFSLLPRIAVALAFVGVFAPASFLATPALAACQGGIIINGEGNPEFDPTLNCNGQGRTTQPAYQNKYTALAVSDSTLAFGQSTEQNTEAAADSVALAGCRKSGARDCKVQTKGENMCLALSMDKAKAIWGADYDRNGANAKAKANAVCQKWGGQHCVIVADPCAHD